MFYQCVRILVWCHCIEQIVVNKCRIHFKYDSEDYDEDNDEI